jgi:hypothetical protein
VTLRLKVGNYWRQHVYLKTLEDTCGDGLFLLQPDEQSPHRIVIGSTGPVGTPTRPLAEC